MLRVSGKAPEGTSQESTLALAMIALPALEWLSPDSLIANFPRFSPEGTTLVHSKSDDVTMGFDHGAETILLSLMPAPLPWSDLELSLIHISEPTRLLSISYAVFCLKK